MTIAKRIEQLEALIRHADQRPVLLREPADQKDDTDFSRQVAEAVTAGSPVIVLAAGDAPRTRWPGVAEVVDNEFAAQLAIASKTGCPDHGTLLRSIIIGCQGGSLPVMASVEG
jgi:hypothetical protein